MNIITIDNVCKNYKSKKALDNVSLSIKQGELFGLLGVNGAGKTTLIKIICGLTRKTSGTITVNNFNLDKEIDKIKEIIDISPQETSVANNLTVKENLEFIASYKRKNDFVDVWVLRQNLNIEELKLQTDEVQAVKWVEIKEWEKLVEEGEGIKSSTDYFLKYFNNVDIICNSLSYYI